MFYNYFDGETVEPIASVPLQDDDIFGMLCKSSGMYGMRLSFDPDFVHELHDKTGWYDRGGVTGDEPCEVTKASGGLISHNVSKEYFTPEKIEGFVKSLTGRIERLKNEAAFTGGAYFLFRTEEERDEAYGNVVGDDGSDTNPYDGELRIYAVTFNPDGYVQTENT